MAVDSEATGGRSLASRRTGVSMSGSAVVGMAVAVGIGAGLAVHFSRQAKISKGFADRIRAELRGAESLTLPELVTRLGLKDGFHSRGKLMGALNPMVAAGEVTQEEPPGTTMKDRLSVLRFRLVK